jgi:hypothetical protein
LAQKLKERFAGDSRIFIVPMAVGDRVGTADFHLTGYHTTNSLLPREETTRRYYPKGALATGEIVEAAITTLDTFREEP